VIAQQRGQLCAGRIAVERLDRIADVDLVCSNRPAVSLNPSYQPAKVTIASRV
jgi:hypothetical protein